MRVAHIVEPELIFEPDRVHHPSRSVPAADRISVPSRFRILGMLAAVYEDLPPTMDVALEHDEVDPRGLRDPPGIRRSARNARRQAVRFGIVFRLPRLDQRF